MQPSCPASGLPGRAGLPSECNKNTGLYGFFGLIQQQGSHGFVKCLDKFITGKLLEQNLHLQRQSTAEGLGAGGHCLPALPVGFPVGCWTG